MNSIYSITPDASGGVTLDQVWSNGALAAGYSNFVPVQIGDRLILFAYNKSTQQTDAFVLTDKAPWIQPTPCAMKLEGGPWDTMSTFVLGNDPYLLTYSKETGDFGVFKISNDLSEAGHYSFGFVRNTPTKGFTTVGPFTAVGQQYILAYDFDTGLVANFSLVVTPTSAGDTLPLLGQNVWYHHWARGWTHFAFFQLGAGTYFFKINTAKLNVNIDHVLDTPAAGTIEVGSYLQSQLPDALKIDIAAYVPWANGEPYLLTYIASSGTTAIYRIHADCLGWTELFSSTMNTGVTQAIPYRIGDTTFVLFYGG